MNPTELATLRESRQLSPRISPVGQSDLLNTSLVSYIEPFFAHKWSILQTVLAFLLIGWLAILLWPRKYESEAKLLIRVGRESVSLDPTATTSQTMMLQKTQEEEINSAIEMMHSRHIAEKTAETIGAVHVIDGYLPNSDHEQSLLEKLTGAVSGKASDALFHFLVMTGIKDDLSDRELAVMELQKSVDVFAPKKSTVLIVKARSKSPNMAQAIADTMTSCFLSEHMKSSGTEGSQEFFQAEVAVAEGILDELLDKRIGMLQERNIESIDSRRDALMQSMGGIESSVRASLNGLEIQEVNLTATLTPNHPQLASLIREVNDTREILDAMQADAGMHGDHQVESKGSNKAAETSDAAPRMEEKKNQFLALRKELRGLMKFQLEMDNLEREIAQADTNCHKLLEKLEEARVIDELQSRQISNISIIQPANFIERAVAPRKKVLAAGFMMLGLMGGLALVVLKEIGATTIRTLNQLKSFGYPAHAVGVPKTGNLMRIFRDSSTRSQRSALGNRPKLRERFKELLSEIVSVGFNGSSDGVVVGVIGVDDRCGASSVATGLALMSDNEGIETTLVDGDMARQTISRTFSTQASAGVADVLRNGSEIAECIQSVPKGSLQLVTATSNGHEHGRQNHEHGALEMFSWLRQKNELVVVDLPTIGSSNQVLDVSNLDTAIVVLESGATKTDDLSRLLQKMQSSNVRVSALVLNKTKQTVPGFLERILS